MKNDESETQPFHVQGFRFHPICFSFIVQHSAFLV